MPLDDRHIILPVAVGKISGEGLENLYWLEVMEKKQWKKNPSKLKA